MALPMGPLTRSPNRIEDRADDAPRILAEVEVGHGEADQTKDRPRVQPPVEERVLHGQLGRRRSVRLRLVEGRVGVVRHGLGDAPEHEGEPHPRLEEHSDLREPAKLGLLALLAQADLAVPAEGQPDDEA